MGVIQARITSLINHPKDLKAFTKTLTEKQKVQARSHYATVRALKKAAEQALVV